MKVLVIGNGAREHALVWKFSESRRISGLYCAPGNAGTGSLCQNLKELSPSDVAGIVRSAEDLSIDLVFVGPEGSSATL